MLAGVLAGQSFASTMTGDASLRSRPMRRVVEPLRKMGAEIGTHERDCAPLEIRGGKLHSIDYSLPIPSAQVKSAILLAGLYSDGVTTVCEPVRTRDHTELALREFGATVESLNKSVRIHPRPKLQARQLIVPGDLSSAVFLYRRCSDSAGFLVDVAQRGIESTRTRILDFLISIGAAIHLASVELRSGELIGDVSVRNSALAGGEIGGAQSARDD